MKLPVVTAIVPTHNHEPWLIKSLKSISSQNYPNLRIVCVNDGSTDNSWEILKDNCKQLNKIPVPKQGEPQELYSGTFDNIPIIISKFAQSYGPSMSRNYAMKTGWDGTDLFALLDSDDEYLPGKIQKSVDMWMEFPTLIGVIYSDYITENAQTGLRSPEFKPPFVREHLLKECIVNCDSIVSKYVIEKVGMFDTDLRVCEDFDLMIRISERSMICHIPEHLVLIRVGKHSSTDSISTERWKQDYQKVFDKMKQRQESRNQ